MDPSRPTLARLPGCPTTTRDPSARSGPTTSTTSATCWPSATAPSSASSTSPRRRSPPTCAYRPRSRRPAGTTTTGTLVAYGWVQPHRRIQPGRGRLLRPPLAGRGPRPRDAGAPRAPRPASWSRAAGHDEAWLGVGAYRQDARTRGWLRAAGFHADTTFTRMRIDLDPATAPGSRHRRDVVVRRVTSEADLAGGARDRGGVVRRALRQRADQPSSAGCERFTDRGDDWVQVWLAELDGDAGRAAGQHQPVRVETRTRATSAPSASCPPVAAGASGPRCCGTTSPGRTARAGRP